MYILSEGCFAIYLMCITGKLDVHFRACVRHVIKENNYCEGTHCIMCGTHLLNCSFISLQIVASCVQYMVCATHTLGVHGKSVYIVDGYGYLCGIYRCY